MKQPARFLGIVAPVAVALAVAVLALAPAGARAAHPSAGFQGTITMYAQTYNPPSVTQALPGQTVLNHYALQSLARAWERAHPGVHIKFVDISLPNQDYYTVLRTRLTGGTAPDIFWFQPAGNAGNKADEYLRAGLILDIAPYLMKPNKYTPDNRHWNDTFRASWQTVGRTPEGKYGAVPQDLVATGVYYNASITQKLGIAIPPKSWAEWMRDLQRVQDAGNLAVSGFPCCLVQKDVWYWPAVSPVFLWRDLRRFAVLKYHPDYVPGYMTTEDWARAIVKLGYRPSKDPGMVAAVRNFKAWSRHFAPGWASANGGNPEQLFATGRLAFYWGGSWELPIFRQQRLPFKFGTFWLPPITKETSPVVPTPPAPLPGIGGYGSVAYAVGSSLAHSPKLPLVIDFLQYITMPKNDQTIVNEHPGFVPATVGAAPDPSLAAFFKPLTLQPGGHQPMNPPDAFTFNDQDTWFRDSVLYLQGITSERDYLNQMDTLMAHSASALIAQNDKTKNKGGAWELTKW